MGTELAIAGLIMSAASAVYSNTASSKQAKFANAQRRDAYEKGKAVQRAQAQVSALEKRRMIQDRYEQFKAATTVSSAERGATGGRTEQALMSSLGIQAARESAKVSMEGRLGEQNFSISNQPQWQYGQSTSPYLAGIQGGLQGLQMGLGIEGAQAQLDAAAQAAMNATPFPTNPSAP